MGFTNPAALIFSVFIAGLILLYLWERQQRRLDIPSMMLWELIPDAVVRRHRFQPDFLFWLQLAALAILVLGLANPYFDLTGGDTAPRRLILVIDLSASMQTTESEGGVSRLSLARDQASRVIQSAPEGSEVMIVGAAREPSIIAPFSDDRAALSDVVAKLNTRDVSTHLEPALALAQRLAFQTDGRAAIHAFTDIPRDSVGERWRDGVTWWPVGSRGDNLAIVGVQTTRGILQNHRSTGARISVENTGTTEKHGSLTVRVGGELVGQELFTAKPKATQSFHFPALAGSGLLEVSLQGEDALALDNHWRAWVPTRQPIRIAVIGATPDLVEALSRLDTASDALVTEFLAEPPSADAHFDLLIFHRTAPKPLPNVPTLLIAPQTDPSSQQRLDVLHEVGVLDWSNTSAVLRGVEPRLLRPFATVTRMPAPSWGEVVLSGRDAAGRAIPLLVVGTPTTSRVAALAADLTGEPFLASDREPLLLLIVNLIDWLAGDRRDQVEQVRTGESKTLDSEPGAIAEIIDPHGAAIEPQSATLDFEIAGVYRMRRVDGGESAILVNFQDAVESDVGRPPPVSYTPPAADITSSTHLGHRSPNGLHVWLYGVATLLLLAEWLTASRIDDHG